MRPAPDLLDPQELSRPSAERSESLSRFLWSGSGSYDAAPTPVRASQNFPPISFSGSLRSRPFEPTDRRLQFLRKARRGSVCRVPEWNLGRSWPPPEPRTGWSVRPAGLREGIRVIGLREGCSVDFDIAASIACLDRKPWGASPQQVPRHPEPDSSGAPKDCCRAVQTREAVAVPLGPSRGMPRSHACPAHCSRTQECREIPRSSR